MLAARVTRMLRARALYQPTRPAQLNTSFVLQRAHVSIGTAFRKRPSTIEYQHLYRRAQQSRQYRQAFNYQRFQTTRAWLQRWAARPTFYYEVAGIGGVCAGYYIINLEEVPVSGRRRFNVVSGEQEAETGKMALQQTLQEYGRKIMPQYTQEHRMVRRVLNRLLPHSGLEDNDWEVYVIDDPTRNAFVIPGGKVFVFRGILDICQDDNGLAAVLGHEIAHNVAHHSAERMSLAFVLLPLAALGYIFGGVDPSISNAAFNFLLQMPGSRKQESEADYIGLLMMAESCYDPAAVVEFWRRMEKDAEDSVPQFLSTHPSHHNRLEKIREWLPVAEDKLESSGCGTTRGFVDEFRRNVHLPQWSR